MKWLGSINKAWVAGVVSFVAGYILVPFFGIELSAETQGIIVGAVVTVMTWAVPNFEA